MQHRVLSFHKCLTPLFVVVILLLTEKVSILLNVYVPSHLNNCDTFNLVKTILLNTPALVSALCDILLPGHLVILS